MLENTALGECFLTNGSNIVPFLKGKTVPTIDEFENVVLDLVTRKLSKYSERFAEASLRADGPRLVVWKPPGPDYESEISCFIRDDHTVFDLLEFHVYRKGKPDASLDQIDVWLDETLEEILRNKRISDEERRRSEI